MDEQIKLLTEIRDILQGHHERLASIDRQTDEYQRTLAGYQQKYSQFLRGQTRIWMCIFVTSGLTAIGLWVVLVKIDLIQRILERVYPI